MGRPTVERVLPLVYLALAVVMVVVLLATALRPPDVEPPSNAQFAPDEPPDEESIIFDAKRGVSGTAFDSICEWRMRPSSG